MEGEEVIVPEVSATPRSLRPYIFHGVDLRWRDGDTHARADCPVCERSSKFEVEIATGVCICRKCGWGGNVYLFIRWLWDASTESTTGDDLEALAADRSVLDPNVLLRWALCKSKTTGDWLAPGYSEEAKLQQLYRYRETWEGERRRMALVPTPTLDHKLFGVDLYRQSSTEVLLCEGLWDAVVLWEVLSQAKLVDGSIFSTGVETSSMLAGTSVLGTPSCTVFQESWASLFSDRVAVLLFDNDHPRTTRGGKFVEPAGLAGMRRVAGILSAAREPPREIRYLRWGADGYDLSLPPGSDVRDLLCRMS